ncbi:MAG: hypothetical protein WBA89_15925 [Microcoleus sp.]
MAAWDCRSRVLNLFLADQIAPLGISKPRPCETVDLSIARNSCLFPIGSRR